MLVNAVKASRDDASVREMASKISSHHVFHLFDKLCVLGCSSRVAVDVGQHFLFFGGVGCGGFCGEGKKRPIA